MSRCAICSKNVLCQAILSTGVVFEPVDAGKEFMMPLAQSLNC